MNFYKLQSGHWLNLAQMIMIEDGPSSLRIFFTDRMTPELVSDHADVMAIRAYLEKSEFNPSK